MSCNHCFRRLREDFFNARFIMFTLAGALLSGFLALLVFILVALVSSSLLSFPDNPKGIALLAFAISIGLMPSTVAQSYSLDLISNDEIPAYAWRMLGRLALAGAIIGGLAWIGIEVLREVRSDALAIPLVLGWFAAIPITFDWIRFHSLPDRRRLRAAWPVVSVIMFPLVLLAGFLSGGLGVVVFGFLGVFGEYALPVFIVIVVTCAIAGGSMIYAVVMYSLLRDQDPPELPDPLDAPSALVTDAELAAI